jgi:hypothetical protein
MAKTDEATLKLIKEVQKRKAEIEKVKKPNWQTNCSFTYADKSAGQSGSSAINLHVCSDLSVLLNIAAFLSERAKTVKEAAKLLEVDSPPTFQWNGYPVQEWIDDLKMRVAQIQIKKKEDKLAQLEKRLNKIVSPELRAEMELEAIQAELDE